MADAGELETRNRCYYVPDAPELEQLSLGDGVRVLAS
jgi:hypothetical protein